MFKGIVNKVKKVVNSLFSVETIEEALGKNIDIDNEMIACIDRWKSIYKDNPPWKEEGVETLNNGASIASEIARLVTLEIKSEVTSEVESGIETMEKINEIYQRKVLKDIKIKTEYAAALGGIVFKPYIIDDDISVDYYLADEFIPVRFDSNGQLIGVVFPDTKRIGDRLYTKLEYHDIELLGLTNEMTGEITESGRAVVIRNYCFVRENNIGSGLGKPTSLTDVPEWGDLEPEVIMEKIDKPLFSYFKMPLANQVNPNSYLGVSVYSRAEDLIKRADRHWSQFNKEYSLSEKKIFTSEELINRDLKGKAIDIPEIISVLDTDEPGFYKEFSPEIRNKSYSEGLEEIFRKIEFNCHLAYGTLSRSDEVAKTATEIKSSRQRSYATVVDIQKSLKESLEHLVYAMVKWYEILTNEKVEEYQMSFDFDDSLAVDSETEQKTYLLEVQAGIRTPESYLMEIYDLTDEQMEEVLPNIDKSLEGDPNDNFE